MELFNSALGKNISFVHPPYFIISGFIGLPNMKYYYVFLCFVFIISVLANTGVMALIRLDHNLRTPKYVAVFNLVFVDLIGSCALVPKVLDIFLFNHYYIPFNDCLTFMFFCCCCLSMQALNLVVLCYDRLIAIMYPLHYHVKVTHKTMFTVIASFWLFAVISIILLVGLITRLSFCDSVVVNSYFCDHGQIYRLACNDYFPSDTLGFVLSCLIFWVPFAIVLSSYTCIGFSLAKVTSAQERVKAFKTCTAHLSLVAIYFIPVLITFTLGPDIHPNARIINLSLTSVIPPMLNPIIYVLQTQEIRLSLKKILKIRKQFKIMVK